MTAAIVWILIALAAVVVLFVSLLLLYAARIRRLGDRVGSFECQVRLGREDWVAGLAVYGVGKLRWYRLMSLSFSPNRVLDREHLELVERFGGPGDALVGVRCRYRTGSQEDELLSLAMREESLDGLVSWLEAAPPRSEPFL